MNFVLRDKYTGDIVENANLTVTAAGEISATSLVQTGNYAALYLTTGTQSIASGGSGTKIAFDSSVVTGLANDIKIASNGFVVHKVGTYLLSGQVTVNDGGGGAAPYQRDVIIQKNSTVVATTSWDNPAAVTGVNASVSFSILLPALAVNDVISVYCFQTSTVPQLVLGATLPDKVTFAQLVKVA